VSKRSATLFQISLVFVFLHKLFRVAKSTRYQTTKYSSVA